jgi:hypothetical protein
MRTSFSKRLVASGLIAAIGANLVATSPAFAGPDRDRNQSRADNNRGDNRGAHRNDGRGDNRNDGRNDGRGRERAPERQAVRGPSQDHRKPAVTVVQKPVAVRREAVHQKPVVKVVQQPVVVQRPVVVHREVHRDIARPRPVVRTDYRPSHAHYGPPPTRVIVVPERRRYRDVVVVRHYGHRYHGYGHYAHDHDAYRWLAFTAISVAIIGALTEVQQRSYEDAQIHATTAPIGETIVWQNGGAAGTVTAVRDGTGTGNRYCREFQQTVTIGGNTEQAYGTACMQPDGAWQVIS